MKILTYSEKLKHPKWQKKRLEILNRDKFTCKKCGDTETTLNIHHLKYTNEPWDAPNTDLITLCEHCHTEIEKHYKDKDLSCIRIIKSDNWQSGNRIMFVAFEETLSMTIYDTENNFNIGFDFPYKTLAKIKKLIKFVYDGK